MSPDFLAAVARRLQAKAPARRVLGNKPSPSGRPVRKAAVLCPLLRLPSASPGAPDELALLYTLRTATLSTHAGQVSFPGGHIDAGEGAADAAVRETLEETGLASSPHGLLDDLVAITGTHVTPVVGSLTKGLEGLTPSPAEVEAVFVVPLAVLLAPGAAGTEWLSPKYDEKGRQKPRTGLCAPYFDGPARIWGLSAFITYTLLRDVLLPALTETRTPLVGMAPFNRATGLLDPRLLPMLRTEESKKGAKENSSSSRGGWGGLSFPDKPCVAEGSGTEWRRLALSHEAAQASLDALTRSMSQRPAGE